MGSRRDEREDDHETDERFPRIAARAATQLLACLLVLGGVNARPARAEDSRIEVSPPPSPPSPALGPTVDAAPPGAAAASAAAVLPAAPLLPPGTLADPAYERAVALRNVGIVLTVVGAVTLIAGAITFGAGAGNHTDSDIGKLVVGSIVMGSSSLALVPGGVLWGVGQSRMNRARAGLVPTLGAAPPGSVGGGLRWTF